MRRGETYCEGLKLVITTLSGSNEEERFPTKFRGQQKLEVVLIYVLSFYCGGR